MKTFLSALLLQVAVTYVYSQNMEGPMGGGLSDMDPKSSELDVYKWAAIKEINAKNKDSVHLVPIEIVKAQSQVVAGMNYFLIIKVGQSECSKKTTTHEQLRAKKCQLNKGGKQFLYDVVVYDVPWKKKTTVTINKTTAL
uniref:Cysteine protease inhibitor n=1 Tax=Steinernema carpocapsae TaxID=34508 RepID=Q0GK33_STECR|nr:cysteine protease inhibitor precursor [Steinernema carpocapsae]